MAFLNVYAEAKNDAFCCPPSLVIASRTLARPSLAANWVEDRSSTSRSRKALVEANVSAPVASVWFATSPDTPGPPFPQPIKKTTSIHDWTDLMRTSTGKGRQICVEHPHEQTVGHP